MNTENQNHKPYQLVIEKVFFGRRYHVAMTFSPAPQDIGKARVEAEALAEGIMRDARVRELLGAPSPTLPKRSQAL